MANKLYENFVLANEIEDQYVSHLNLLRFATIDNSLTGTAGMTKKVHQYRATNGTEKVAMGVGNSKSIETTYNEAEYKILCAQNNFPYYDEEAMTDPVVIQTGLRHMATDLYNTVNADIYAEFAKADSDHTITGAFNFDAFADAVATLDVAGKDEAAGSEIFAFVHKDDMAALRKALKDELKYVEAFVRTGYIGTVCGINLYANSQATKGTIVGGMKEAVTVFNKKGTEVAQERDENIRKNTVYSRKYYVAAITDFSKAFKIVNA